MTIAAIRNPAKIIHATFRLVLEIGFSRYRRRVIRVRTKPYPNRPTAIRIWHVVSSQLVEAKISSRGAG